MRYGDIMTYIIVGSNGFLTRTESATLIKLTGYRCRAVEMARGTVEQMQQLADELNNINVDKIVKSSTYGKSCTINHEHGHTCNGCGSTS